MAFKVNTVAEASAMSEDLAFSAGAAAAMALPPQILVHTLTSHAQFLSILKNLPSSQPKVNPMAIPAKV